MSKPNTICVATLSTPNFEFAAADTTAIGARSAMLKTLKAHKAQYGARVTWTKADMAEMMDEVRIAHVPLGGVGSRDGEAIR